MCDDYDWDDDSPVEIPNSANQGRPIQSQSFGNRSFNGSNRPRLSGDRTYNRERNNRSFQRNDDNNFNWRDNKFGGGSSTNSVNGGNRFYRDGRTRPSNENSEIMKIPCRFIGKIIGRGGSKIQELQTDSGAKIQVTKETDGDVTVVKIFGSLDAIAKAKDLISDITVDKIRFVEAKDMQLIERPPKREIIDWKAYLKECEEAEAAEWAKYPPIKKEFYIEHPEVTSMSEKDVEVFRANNNNIVVDRTFKTDTSAPIPKPCPKFYHAFHNYPEILDEIKKAGFEKPSPIQAQAWPVLLSGEDLIGIAQTGTGKTLAFLLPALIHIDGQSGIREERGGPAVLIMAPTRELALQIDREIKKYQYRGITSVCLYGGGNRKEQVKVLTKGVDIVIATPGRLNDLIAAEHLDVRTVTYAVLDEADRMLDMGFEPQIRKVMYAIRPTRQTVMTSATWPLGVRRLADSYMKDPVQVYIGSLDLAATHTVTQVIKVMPDDDDFKFETFMDFARNLGPEEKIIVFCGKKARADDLSSELALAGIQCQSLHGDRDQSDREQALLDIQEGTVRILIATDVASRGLDIEDVTHVLNYDFPRNIEEYVHRVGRTGRAGKSGESISYFTRNDWAQAEELINILNEAQQDVPEELQNMADRYGAWKEKKEKSNGGRGPMTSRFNNTGGRRW